MTELKRWDEVPERIASRAERLMRFPRTSMSLRMRLGTPQDKDKVVARLSDPKQIRTVKGPAGDFLDEDYPQWMEEQHNGECDVVSGS